MTRPPSTENGSRGSSAAPADLSFNLDAARMLRDCAQLLREQDANPFRVNAYEHAARTLESLDVDARTILGRHGPDGLVELPAIGAGIAAAIDEIARTGRLARLERLRGSADPETLLRSVPGIGAELARRIHELGRTRDWVVVYFHDDDHSDGQRTIVTETHGPLRGRRVVRGREPDCRGHYAL